jgi:ubiquinone/menaquinone biosynthesis C-methylase UbiE
MSGVVVPRGWRNQMPNDLSEVRENPREEARIRDLLALLPRSGDVALDVGAREGYISRLLTERFRRVVALDLETPDIVHPGIEPVRGDVTQLTFDDNMFDTVLCAEVLEHIPPDHLAKACREIARVAQRAVVIGVPYKQDIRCARTTCSQCGKHNPPWGHLNTFDEARLRSLFDDLVPVKVSYVGSTRDRTNVLSSTLLDFAGNPYGSYDQKERCVSCGAKLQRPPSRTVIQKMATTVAMTLNGVQQLFVRPRANWVHVRFEKSPRPHSRSK